MTAREKKQCPIRFYQDVFERIQEKAKVDGINFQQLGDLLFTAYLRNNKEIMKLVHSFTDSKHGEGRRKKLNELEKEELLRLIETKYSPLKDFKETIKEIEDDEL